MPALCLMQVGYIGLTKAINNFDPAVGGSLAAYAQPTILGEIMRHFRDTRWQVHVKRPVQELVLEARETARQLTQELWAAPGPNRAWPGTWGSAMMTCGRPGFRKRACTGPRWTPRQAGSPAGQPG